MMYTKAVSIHRRIRSIRIGSGLTQEAVAEACGVSKSAVCNWEHGRALPRASTMRKVARILGTTVAALYGEKAAA